MAQKLSLPLNLYFVDVNFSERPAFSIMVTCGVAGCHAMTTGNKTTEVRITSEATRIRFMFFQFGLYGLTCKTG